MSLGTLLIDLVWGKLRKSQLEYVERRKSAPHESNPELARRWFWLILMTGVLLPFTSLAVIWLRRWAGAYPPEELWIESAGGVFLMGIVIVPPFLVYAIHSSKRLVHDRSQRRPVKGGLIGLSVVYAFFCAVFAPWLFSVGSTDPAGMGQAFAVYFVFLVPALGFGGLLLGRLLAPARVLPPSPLDRS